MLVDFCRDSNQDRQNKKHSRWPLDAHLSLLFSNAFMFATRGHCKKDNNIHTFLFQLDCGCIVYLLCNALLRPTKMHASDLKKKYFLILYL